MTSTASSAYINHEPTYHNREDAAYVLPNDTPEHVRLETQARNLSAIMNDKIIHAPISTTARNLRMLDVGCGTGIVTDYLAQRYQSAQIFGLDLSPVPDLRPHPPNVHFLQGNILQDKPHHWQSSPAGANPLPQDQPLFDLIFSRLLVCGMSNWPAYISTAHTLLKPGGHLEIHDIDWIWYNARGEIISDAWPWWQRVRAAGEAAGLDWACASNAASRMEGAGFVDVQTRKYRWPFGGRWERDEVWREFGEYVCTNMVEMIWHMIPRVCGDAGEEEEVREMRERMRWDLRAEEGKHWVFYVTVGRKAE